MEKVLHILISCLLILSFSVGCKRRLTEKEIYELSLECSRKDSVSSLYISFVGYNYDDIKRISVKCIKNGLAVDSFSLSTDDRTYDPERTQYYTFIDRSLCIRDSFIFVIPLHHSYLVSNMRMTLHSHFTMFSEGYGCDFDGCYIDGVDSDIVCLKKEGFKYTWE